MNIDRFQRIISGSKRYEFEDGNDLRVLVITNYNTGERVKLDLSLIDEDILECLLIPDEDEDEDEYDEEVC